MLLTAAEYTAQCLRNRYDYVKIVTRQQFRGALLKPLMDLIPVTSRAMPVTTGMIDGMLNSFDQPNTISVIKNIGQPTLT